MSYCSRMLKMGALAGAIMSLWACAPGMRVNSFVEKASDFSKYRTYKFGPADTSNTGDPRLDDNRFFNDRVQADVDKMLAARGFEKTSGPRADMLVHYHASVTQQIDLNDTLQNECSAAVAAGGPGTVTNCRAYVYDAGTLLIDLVDGRTNQLVWRGWAEGSIDGVLENQAWMEQRVDESVRRIMEKLPRQGQQPVAD